MQLKEIYQLIEKTYLVTDRNLLKIIIATVIANRLPLSPVWLFIVGAPGSGKTEFLSMAKECRWMIPISNLTPSSLASGSTTKGVDPSLLKRAPVKKGAIILMKDFTSMLSLNSDSRSAIMGQFREVYDGEYVKHFGNGKIVKWDGKLGMIACVTDEIYAARELYAAMGERFIMYHPQGTTTKEQRIDITMRATGNVGSLDNAREVIRQTVKDYVDIDLDVLLQSHVANGIDMPPEEARLEFAKLAEFVSRARSPVKRDLFSKDKHITHANEPEMPTRIAEQLTALSIGLMVINEHELGKYALTMEDMKVLYNIALDCMSPQRRGVLRTLTQFNTASAYAIAQRMGYPYTTAKRWLDDLTVLGVLSSEKASNGQEAWWLKTEYRALMARYEGIEQTDESLTTSQYDEEETSGLPTF